MIAANKSSLFPNGIIVRTEKDRKIKAFKKHVRLSRYFEPKEQLAICREFGLPHLKNVFRSEYRSRFYIYLFNNVTTCSVVSSKTSIPQKYLCECKAYFEKRGLLKVVMLGVCPYTNSRNVQFLSTNPQFWKSKDVVSKSNQLILF